MHAMSSRAVDEPPWDLAAQALQRYRAGERAALDDLVRAMTPVLWQIVRAERLDADCAADTIQSVWLAFVRSEASIIDPQAVAKWLTTSARRAAAKAATKTRVDAVEDEVLATKLPAQRSAESTALQAAEASDLWQAVLTLDPRCQKLLRVIAFEQRPDYAHLANDLDMPVGSIGPTRSRCLQKLRRALDPQGVQ